MVVAPILRPSGAGHFYLAADPQAYAMWLMSYAPPGLGMSAPCPYIRVAMEGGPMWVPMSNKLRTK
jgi:hypothetical protein